MYLLFLKTLKVNFLVFCSTLLFILPSNSQNLSSMVEKLLSEHEDIINAKKELEEAGRDVTDSLLAYAPDLSVKYEADSNDKYNSGSKQQIDGFDTFDWTWKQKIMDSGATLADINNKRLELDAITHWPSLVKL